MKQPLSKLFLFILLCLCFTTSFAKHIKGGWIFYQYLGPGIDDPTKLLYKVTVKVFRDCAIPDPNQNDAQIGITIFNTTTGAQLGGVSASLVAIDTLNKVSYSACINTNPPVCYHILRYEQTMELAAISSGYTLSYQRCCRINGIINVTSPSNDDGNTFTIRIPGNQVNANYPKNNSPVFAQNDTVLVCYNAHVSLDFSALDPDSDSLSYAFTPGITGGSVAVPAQNPSFPPPFASISYQSPYTANDPFGTGLQIDNKTGIISGFSPSAIGEYVVAVSVKEYRSGNFIAETRKELHVSVAACSFAEAVLPNIQLLCNGFSTTFVNNSVSSNNRSYTWDFGVNGILSDTSHLPTPSFSYPDSGVFTIKLIVNKGEECSDSTTSVIEVYPGLHAGFYATGICQDAPFHFFDTTHTRYGTVNSWAWNFGDVLALADTAHGQNPQYQYLDSGKSMARLIAGNTRGCFDTAYLQIAVMARPILTLPFHDTLICSIDTLQLFANSNVGTAFSWLPNSRIVNPNVQDPLVFPDFTTTYSVTVNNQGCSSIDSIKVNVLPYITVDAGMDTLICRTDGTTLNPVSQALSYKWAPTVYLNNANVKRPIATPLVPSITYYVTANLGKCQAIDSVVIKTSPYPAATIRSDTSICFNTVVKLYATTNGNSYLWLPSNLVQDPDSLVTEAYPKDTTVFTLVVSDTGGCPKPDTVTVKVIVAPKLHAGFYATGLCKDVPFQFLDTSSGRVNSWAWNFGDKLTLADTSTIQNPQYQYLDSGKSMARLIASNLKGCYDTAYALVGIIARPTLTLPFHDTLICSIDTLQLFANSNIVLPFSWLPNSRIVDPIAQNPLVFPNTTTTYSVTVNNQGCSSVDSIKVNVLPYITVDAGPDTLVCLTDAIALNPVSVALSYKWTPNIYLSNTNIKRPIATPLVPTITYYVTANLGKCQVVDSVTIKTSPYPVATIRPDTSICLNTVVNLYATAKNGNFYLWSPSNLVQNPYSLVTVAYPKDTTVFTLMVYDTSGCPKPATATVKVTVVPKVQVFAGNDTSIVYGQPLLFQSTASSFANIYVWAPASGLNAVNLLQPTAIITNTILGNASQITYFIKASTSIGCSATSSITVHIYKTLPTIFVPSAFTPNGDGKNDVIKPILAGMQRLVYFRVYSRYGQLVFETQQQNVGWDGWFKGQLQGSAAFVFSAEAVDYNDKVIDQTGTFVLIR